jgi:hypothetical protein
MNGEHGERLRPQIVADLRAELAALARPDGIHAQASVWIVSARAAG